MKVIKIDTFSWFFIVGLVCFTMLVQNGFYVMLPLLTLLILLYHVQRPFTPGVFSLIIIQHYFQIAAGVWLCNYLNKDIDYNTPSRSTATIACCFGLLFLLIPILYVQQRLPRQTFLSLKKSAMQYSSQKVLYAYIISFFISSSLASVAFIFGGLTQIIISFMKVKWLLFLLFGYQSILKNENKKLFALFVVLEFLNGFLGFFFGFKTVVFFLLILVISLIDKLNFKYVVFVVFIGLSMGFFALSWSSIKGDYRKFLNGGSNAQKVVVDRNQAIDKLVNLSKNVNSESLNDAMVGFLDRLQYTYHFAKTIDRVPDILPFENGKNWLASIEFTTTPRLLNPNKPILEATIKTKKYTGIAYLGNKDGVSFSLGYFSDCFIDFGLYGMMIALLALGILYAGIYFYLLRKSSKNVIFNYATVGAFFVEFHALEMDSTYLLGRLFASVVTFFVLVKFFFPWLIRMLSLGKGKKDTSISLNI